MTVKHYRPGTADENAMSEVRSYAKVMRENDLTVKGKVVLDVGAHIGCFTRLALDSGAKRVIAYEPHPANFGLLAKNCPEAILHNSALVSDGRLVTPLVVGWQHNPAVGTERFSTSRSTTRNIHVADVRCESFREAVRGVQVVKFDAEGAEYDLLNAVPLPRSVEFLVGEFDCGGSFRLPDGTMTGTVGSLRNGYKPLWDLVARIEAQGFEYVGKRNAHLPKVVFLVHVLFKRRRSGNA
jgi:FkbM family methyltransferase